MFTRVVETWAINIANSVTFLRSGGRKVLHEGHYRHGTWVDWNRWFRCRPRNYAEPATEEEICRLVASAKKVRVVGGGHSFNSAPLSDDLLLSLHRYNCARVRDDPVRPAWKIAEVQAGIRLRDLNRCLAKHQAALPVAGSTDQQSIGGLISTDLHGTGRDHGFLSQCLLSLRVVDEHGKAVTFCPGDPVFHAAIGGAGTCGVIIGAEILAQPAYNLSKTVRVVDRDWTEKHLESLLDENNHLSFYYFGGLAKRPEQDHMPGVALVRMNKWNRTVEIPNRGRRILKVFDELFELAFSGHLIELARAVHRTDWLAGVAMRLYSLSVNHRSVIYSAEEGFARLLFFRHDEIEYGIHRDDFRACIDDVYSMLRERRYPTIIEIRFTPNESQAMLGPGVGRPTAYIELAPSLSRDSDAIFREFERIVVKYKGQPHLGKKVYLDRQQMEGIYGAETMQAFRATRQSQDASGKFMNDFTERILGG